MKLSEKLKKLKEESLIGNIYPTDEVEDKFDKCIKDAELLESNAENLPISTVIKISKTTCPDCG